MRWKFNYTQEFILHIKIHLKGILIVKLSTKILWELKLHATLIEPPS